MYRSRLSSKTLLSQNVSGGVPITNINFFFFSFRIRVKSLFSLFWTGLWSPISSCLLQRMRDRNRKVFEANSSLHTRTYIPTHTHLPLGRESNINHIETKRSQIVGQSPISQTLEQQERVFKKVMSYCADFFWGEPVPWNLGIGSPNTYQKGRGTPHIVTRLKLLKLH